MIKECRHDDIRSLYVKQLAYIWVEDPTEVILTRIQEKIDRFVRGDLDHAAETVSALWKVIHEDGEIKAPSGPSSTVGPLWVCIPHGSAHST